MLKTFTIGIAIATMALSAAPAMADPWKDESGHGRYERYDRHDRDGRYYEPRRVSRDEIWRGRDGRYYCRRSNGTTGLVIGAAGGALLGRALDGGRDRATGTILGAAAGALLGREVQQELRCR